MDMIWGIYGISLQNIDNKQLLIVVVGLTLGIIIFGVAAVLSLIKWKKIAVKMQRYDLIAEQKELIWLDYHFSPQHLEAFGAISQLSEKESLNMMGAEVFEIYDWVHPENASIRSELRQFFDSGERYFKTELRVRKLDGEYGWYSLMGTLEKDIKGKNSRFVVNLENVDVQLSQEKDLVEKAETDLLTGIYNKKTLEEKMGEALAHRHSNESYVFFMIDLDNFKTVNDTLGHAYGDKVLQEAADKLKKVFPRKALIGRLGGDEFAVCACFEAFDVDNLTEYMEQKGEQLCTALRTKYYQEDISVGVSSSIGISSSPGDGVDFMTVYMKADKALYLSKRSGKNRYNIFKNSDANE